MNKKKILSLLLAFALLLTISVGSTLAYLVTKTDSITNTFALGDFTYYLSLDANAPQKHSDDEVTMPNLSPESPQTVAAASAVFTASGTPVLEGYTFDTWCYDDKGNDPYVDIVDNDITVSYGDIYDKEPPADIIRIELFAKWIANNYQVVYNGNEANSGEMTPSTHTFDVPSNLSKNTYGKIGYTFKHWSMAADGSGTTYADEASILNLTSQANGEVNLFAQWTPNTYTIKYDGNEADGGSTPASTHTYDVEQPLTANGYTRTGYEFVGWSTNPDGTGSTFTDKQKVVNLTPNDGDEIVLYAQWKQMDFTLTFDKNLNTATVDPASKTVTYGQAYGDLAVATDDNYKLIGWTFTKDGTDYVTPDTIVNIAGDHTVYAKWQVSTKYTITYYANASDATFTGGAKQVSDQKDHDSTYIIKTPTELSVDRGDSWIWTEWNTKPDGTGDSYVGTAEYSANADLTLYAIWKTKTDVVFGAVQFVNMGNPSTVPGGDEYNFTVKCKTQGGADGISIPMYHLQPGYAYRLRFTVTFNQFNFYTEDSRCYIFGTNIIENSENYHSGSSILSQENKTVTHKYENMQWSTEAGGHYEVTLDFVASQETMYWFWETTDIVDGYEMSYEFNNFNISMLKEDGPYGARIAFEDLTVKYATAPYINTPKGTNALTAVTAPINTSTNTYGTRWVDYKDGASNELTARHKNYFHTEYYGFDHLQYRMWGYDGHEVMTIPITGLEVGKTYTITFGQDLSKAHVYNTSGLNNNQLYGCAVTANPNMDAEYRTSNSVNNQPGYQDLRRARVGANSTQSITFTATAETMYWQWLLGDLIDGSNPSCGYRYSVVKLYDVKLTRN